jgi:thioredoxin reductase (NADPH)
LYPVLEELLLDWTARVRIPYDGIRVFGTTLSPQCYNVKEFLARNHVPYQWTDVEADAAARELVSSLAGETARLPVIVFPDGTHAVAPTSSELADRIGMHTKASRPFYDFVIIGAGPAGLAAGVYGASEGLGTLMVEHDAPGGQAGTSSSIENYLGFPAGISGSDLARRARDQALRFGAELLSQRVESITRADPYRVVRLQDGSEVTAYAVLLATGVSVRELDAPGITRLTGAGVYYGAALSEAATYRDKDVIIVGAANSAGQGALFFSRTARRVTVLSRGAELGASMSRYLVDRIAAAQNIDVLTGTSVVEARGERALESVLLRRADGSESEMPVDALFIFIGAAPRTEFVAGLVARDEKGYLLTGPDLPRLASGPRGWSLDRDPYLFETNVPGIFAAGDVRAGSSKRVAAAVGEGSATVSMVHRYLQTV